MGGGSIGRRSADDWLSGAISKTWEMNFTFATDTTHARLLGLLAHDERVLAACAAARSVHGNEIGKKSHTHWPGRAEKRQTGRTAGAAPLS
jgi:hypothetical protein